MKYGNALMAWLPLALVISGMSVLVYATLQENYREALNDPQIQMVEDAARALSRGDVPASVVPRGVTVDIAQSLVPWIAVYDEKGMGLESTGILDNEPPRVPQGVLDAAAANAGKDTTILGQNRITWQPREGVRSAVVVQHFMGPKLNGFVVVGRNMREVEEREHHLLTTIVYAWLVLILATLVVQVRVARYLRR